MERSGRPASAPVRGTRPADLETVSDAGLVVAIGRFHHDALAEAYRRHGAAAFGLALRIVADRRLAEEVVQEVFLRLWNEPEKFDPSADRCVRICSRRLMAAVSTWCARNPRDV